MVTAPKVGLTSFFLERITKFKDNWWWTSFEIYTKGVQAEQRMTCRQVKCRETASTRIFLSPFKRNCQSAKICEIFKGSHHDIILDEQIPVKALATKVKCLPEKNYKHLVQSRHDSTCLLDLSCYWGLPYFHCSSSTENWYSIFVFVIMNLYSLVDPSSAPGELWRTQDSSCHGSSCCKASQQTVYPRLAWITCHKILKGKQTKNFQMQ